MRLTEAQISVMQSDIFLETFIKQLRQLFSNQLNYTVNQLIEQTDNIKFHRKSVIFRAQFENMVHFQESVSMAFLLFLKSEFYIHYKNVDKSTWCITFDQLSDIDLAKGGLLIAARKTMVANNSLPPKVIAVDATETVTDIAARKSIVADMGLWPKDSVIDAIIETITFVQAAKAISLPLKDNVIDALMETIASFAARKAVSLPPKDIVIDAIIETLTVIAARKAMVPSLPPNVIDMIAPSQGPLYSPANRAATVMNIAYLGKSKKKINLRVSSHKNKDIMKGSIHLICESVDECGRIIKQANIDVRKQHEK